MQELLEMVLNHLNPGGLIILVIAVLIAIVSMKFITSLIKALAKFSVVILTAAFIVWLVPVAKKQAPVKISDSCNTILKTVQEYADVKLVEFQKMIKKLEKDR